MALDFDGKGAEQLAKDNDLPLPPTAIGRTGGGGLHYLYKSTDCLATTATLLKGDGCHIELRAESSYIALPPSLHPSGNTYHWVIPPEEGIAELPDKIRAMATAAEEQETATVDFPTDKLPERFEKLRTSNHKLQELREQPAPPDASGKRDQSARDFALTCRCLEKGLNETETATVVWLMPHGKRQREAKEGKAQARQHKYVISTVQRAAAATNIPTHEKRREPITDGSHLVELIPSGGLIAQYYELVKDTTDAPAHFHLFAGLSLVGTALERRVVIPYGPMGIYPNLYVLLLAPSSRYHKTTVQEPVKRLLSKLQVKRQNPAKDPGSLLLPTNFSPESLYDILQGQPVGLIAWSEFDQAMAHFGRDYMAGTIQFLSEIYDCPDQLVRRLRSQKWTIRRPTVSIFAASTPDSFALHVGKCDVVSGFLPQFIFAPAIKKTRFLAIPGSLSIDGENALLSQLNDLRQALPTDQPTAVSIERIADDYSAWAEEMDRQCAGIQGEQIIAAFYQRLIQTALKLAMIFELTETGAATISPDNWERSCRLVKFLREYVVKLVGDDLAFTPYQRQRRDVLKVIQQAGQISRSDLNRQLRMARRDLEEVTEGLQDEGLIQKVNRKSPGGGRPAQVFVYCGA